MNLQNSTLPCTDSIFLFGLFFVKAFSAYCIILFSTNLNKSYIAMDDLIFLTNLMSVDFFYNTFLILVTCDIGTIFLGFMLNE